MIYTLYMIYMDNQEEGLAVEKCRNEEKSELRILWNYGISHYPMRNRFRPPIPNWKLKLAMAIFSHWQHFPTHHNE